MKKFTELKTENKIQENLELDAKMVCMSHLSDLKEMFSNDKEALNKLNFVSKIIMDTKGDLNQIIDADAMWKEFQESRFFRR